MALTCNGFLHNDQDNFECLHSALIDYKRYMLQRVFLKKYLQFTLGLQKIFNNEDLCLRNGLKESAIHRNR